VSDAAELVFGKAGETLFKGRDVGVFTEDGFTLDEFGKPKFEVEGFGIDLDFGNRFTSGIDNFNDKLLLGRDPKLPLGYQVGAERETAFSVTGQEPINTGVVGESIFGLLNRTFFK
jgi:hypothetical protein